MPTRWDDFAGFLHQIQGKRLLHLAHRDADCDALGSAYAMSRVLPGAVGFAGEMKDSAQDLANWLGLKPVVNPDPADFEYTILYDTISQGMVGAPLPAHYALFDHHEPGGHRNSECLSLLSGAAEWAWVKPVESTCSVLVDLFIEQSILVDAKMSLALAAGIMTDTGLLHHANGSALQRLAWMLEPVGLYVEDVLAVIDNPGRKAAVRSEVLQALQGMHEKVIGDWNLLATETKTREHGLAVINFLNQLGSDIRVVGFSLNGQAMVFSECQQAVVECEQINLAGLMADLAEGLPGAEAWGTRSLGRIMAPLPVSEMTRLCEQAITDHLQARSSGSIIGHENT